jgi:hypothetical protein
MSGEGMIYYLPGRGGRIDTGLGLEIQSRGFNVCGREMSGDFQRLRFSDQIQVIAADLEAGFWTAEALVVANSFGAYLYLHAQTLLNPFLGKVLLLSPIIGTAASPGNGPRFSPPFTGRLEGLVEAGKLRVASRCEIHVGELDWQCQPETLKRFGAKVGIAVNVVAGGGHMLDKGYGSQLLDAWLPNAEPAT